MNKNEDALRANAEYLQKPNISEIGLANLYRIYAVLLMISIDSEHAISSIKFFKKALKIYHTNNIMKGVAIWQLGIWKICHDRFDELTTDLSNEWKDEFIKQCFSLNQNAYELFNEINWNEAASQWAMIETSLKEKLEGKQDTSDKSSETDSIKYSSMMHEDNSILLSNYYIYFLLSYI